MSDLGLFLLCAVVLVTALILGGSTRSGYLSDFVLQVISLPLLLVALWQMSDGRPGVRVGLLAFCAASVLVPLTQTLPLPPAVWGALPNRQAQVEILNLLEAQLPWLPISVFPTLTWLSALSLLVPLSIFFGTMLLSY